jgi:hypothetical protein
MDVFLGRPAGIRENALVARAFGVSKAQLLRCLMVGLEYGTLCAMDPVATGLGDVLENWS